MAASRSGFRVGRLVALIAVCELAGVAGAAFTAPAIPTWYASLAKPWFTPPNWLFGPAWTTLYAIMAVAAWLVWERGIATPGVRRALVLFALQLVLNTAWSPLFFGLRSPLAGLAVILALWAVLLAALIAFWRVRPVAGWLLIPYLAWVTYATALNAAILRLNG